MSLPRTSDTAAKQILDSTRVFKEYSRVRREAERFQGSLFWKPVGRYEYLAQKVGGKVTYLGPRSPETERKFDEFKEKKPQVQQRFRRLKASVESCERMNKAVRAGAVPTAVVDALQQLEATGLSEDSVVLGTPALFAYCQPAGVRVDEVRSPSEGSLVDDAKSHLQVLLYAPEEVARKAFAKLQRSVDAIVEIVPAGKSGERTCFFIEFKFLRGREPFRHSAKDAYWRQVAMQMAPTVDAATKCEQVIIGKTGTMATMRTLDPKFFVMVNKAAAEAGAPAVEDPQEVRTQAEVVASLIQDDLLVAKLPESERRTVEAIAQRVFAHG